MKKNFVILGICFLFGTGVVITLYSASDKIMHDPGSFLRMYQRPFIQANETDIGYNSYYLTGITDDHIYLRNVTAPFRLLVTKKDLTDSQHITLRIRNVETPTVHKSATVKIDPPYFYLADGMEPVLYRGIMGEWVAEPFSYDSTAYFNQLVPTGNSSFAIRTHASQTLDNMLGKVQQDTPRIQLKPTLLQKQVDGVFCTDGMLLYNTNLKRLIYTYYYRNEFIVYDTNLNLDYRGHTIDTFSRARIKVGYINSEKSKQLLDKKVNNIISCTSGDYLFIRSNLMAKNDAEEWFDKNSIIDVYDLKNSVYHFSFTLPDHDEKKVRDMMVFNKTLIVLYDHYMVKYDLQPDYL